MRNGSPRAQYSAANSTLLGVQDLEIAYGAKGWLPRLRPKGQPVIHGVSFRLAAHETMGLVGESGSGKTTIARAVAGLLVPSRGQILFSDQDITGPIERRSRELHRQIQFVFQNPDASLNPRRRVSHILGRPLEFFFGLSGRAKRGRIEELLRAVHLDPSYIDRFPGQLSGGERQRVAIAQALAAEPRLILCDEIVSALDVSVQANILDLLRELQDERGIAYLFISHDLAVVRWLATWVGVLYLGRMMEIGTAEEVFSPPYHPYTEMLLQAVPEPDPGQPALRGTPEASSAVDMTRGTGCPFAPVCPRKVGPVCDEERPPWRTATATHAIYCHIPLAELRQMQTESHAQPQ
ncbi:MAG: oligopeptide/dipeptide ABC transporter ATP-binding protein [bacterium]